MMGIAFYTLNVWPLDFFTPDFNPKSIFYLRAFRVRGLWLDAGLLLGQLDSFNLAQKSLGLVQSLSQLGLRHRELSS